MIKGLGAGIQQPSMEENMSNLTSASGEAASVSSITRNDNNGIKKRRNQPGHPEPGADVIALSPRTLLATNRFVCEVCNKGFQRDQNLQLHRRGHNLPWKLKQRTNKEILRKKVYICPEISCVHHDPSRALGDSTGIKKHFFRKHGEKKWKCEKCSKKYAVQSDLKAHSKICGTREYRCDCGTIFSRRDSFITHRAFCDALAQENARSANSSQISLQSQFNTSQNLPFQIKKEQQSFIPPWLTCSPITVPSSAPPPPLDLIPAAPPSIFQDFNHNQEHFSQTHDQDQNPNPNPSSRLGPTTLPSFHHPPPPHISATALLQKAAQMGSKSTTTTQFPPPTGRPYHAHVPAGFGSSRDEFVHGLASYGHKADTVTGGMDTGAPLGGNITPPPPLIHEMMMMNNAGFGGPTFDDIAFGEISNSKKDDQSFHAFFGQFSSRRANEGDNMTRDFLGLRPLSQSEILSITCLDNCINNNSCNDKFE